jgi:hypothetical protein
MKRLLERIPASPDKKQKPGKSIRQEAALTKGKTGWEFCGRHGGQDHRPQISWEASDQRGTAQTPLRREWRLCIRGKLQRGLDFGAAWFSGITLRVTLGIWILASRDGWL